jgi:D-glycero-D-manno-heptose 1,7-bisphosphate phosphatase
VTRRAIFLDRDGTLSSDLGFTYRTSDLVLLDGVVPGLRRMAQLGYRLLIVTNQSGVGRGRFSLDDMHAFNRALVARLGREGIAIDGVYACPFHPDAVVAEYRFDSPLRKPRPGMLLEAAAEHGIDLKASFAIGDRLSDVAAGRSAGCRTILISSDVHATAAAPEIARCQPDSIVPDLVAAARFVEHAAAPPTGALQAADCSHPLSGHHLTSAQAIEVPKSLELN